MLEARLLGQFDLRLAGQPVEMPSRLAQSLLAYLMVNAGTAHRREKLAGLLWPDVPDDIARRNLRQTVYALRKVIELGDSSSFILADEISVSFNRSGPYWLDLDAFQAAKTLDASIDALTNAARAYQGELLPGFYDEWVIVERERLEVVFDRKMEQLLDHLIEERRWSQTIEWGEHWIAFGHAPEPAYRAEMIAYWRLDNLAGVGATYHRCEETLARELGVIPSEKTVALYTRLARGLPPESAASARDSEVTAAAAPPREQSGRLPPAPGVSPFMGLQSFGEEDAHLYFGREELTDQLAELVLCGDGQAGRDAAGSGHVVTVVGASGSGKSSLVRAGLVPALLGRAPEQQGPGPGLLRTKPAIFFLTPTAHPLEAVATCLVGPPRRSTHWRGLVDGMARDATTLGIYLRATAASDSNLPVLIVDQLEELFTLCRAEQEREAFVDNILQAAALGAASVVLALRADFYGHCGEYARLRSAITCCQIYLSPMSASEMRRAIEQPAALNGWTFEPGLVDLILRDAGGGSGALPLLSHALLETWNRRSDRMLTLQGYAEAHGVRGAIAKTADAVYYSLRPELQTLARGIFLRLTELGEGTEDTRRSASLDELVAQSWDRAEVDEVLDILTDARLITASEGTVEVAHEALIREWATLRSWLDEDREGLKIHRHVTESAQAWDGLQRDPGELYRGARLAQALEWSARRGSELNPLEQAFLDASVQCANREAAEREAHQQRELESARKLAEAEAQRILTQKRASRRLKSLAAGLAVLLLLALALGGFAWLQQQRVRKQTQIAVSRSLSASAMGSLHIDPQRSLLLALEAEQTADTVESRQALHSAVLASRALRAVPIQFEPLPESAFSSDGSLFAVSGLAEGGQPATEIFEVDSGRSVLAVAGDLAGSSWPPSGVLVTRSSEGDGATRFTYWEVPSGRAISSTRVAFPAVSIRTRLSPDAQRAAVQSDNGAVDLWNLRTGKRLRSVLAAGRAPVAGVAFTPAGDRLLVHESGMMRILDLAQGTVPFSATVGLLAHAVFAPDGRRLAVSDQGAAAIYDAEAGTTLLSLPKSQTGYVLHLAYSQDGGRLATAGGDGTVKIWDAASGKELLSLPGHNEGVVSVAFSPSGELLATVGLDRALRVWDLSAAGGHEWWAYRDPAGAAFTGLALSDDGKRMAATNAAGTVRVWDFPAGSLVFAAQDSPGLQGSLAFSPDGRLLASTNSQRTVQVREVPSGRLLLVERGAADLIGALAFRPDGREVAALDYGRSLRVWTAGTGKLHLSLWGMYGFVDPSHKLGIAYSHDGARIATGGSNRLRIWDAETGFKLLESLELDARANAVAFDPTGKRLAAGLLDGEAGIWDSTTGDLVLVLPGHTASIETLAFSRDGGLLATGSSDSTVKIWDPSTGAQVLTLPGHTGELTGVAFTPDANRLVTASRDGTLRIYALDPNDLVSIARARLTRTWTEAECKKYLPGGICPPGR